MSIWSRLLRDTAMNMGMEITIECPRRSPLCNAIVGRPFQADIACRVSLSLGRLGQPGKADLQMRCKAGQGRETNRPSPPPPLPEGEGSTMLSRQRLQGIVQRPVDLHQQRAAHRVAGRAVEPVE